jgi:hypothetical protein
MLSDKFWDEVRKMQPFCGGRSGQCSREYISPGLFHVRPMQTSVSNRGASYFYRQELPLSGLYTGVVIIIIIIITITIITNVIIIIIMRP